MIAKPNTSDKSPANQIRGFFVPDLAHILLHLISGFLLMVIFEIRPIWRYLNSQVFGTEQQAGDNILHSLNLDRFLNIWSSFSGNRLVQIAIWVILGIWVYVFIWFVKNILTNVYNDVVAEEYIHPRSFKRSAYWRNVLGLKGIFLASLITIITYCIVGLRIISELGRDFYLALENFDWISSPAIWIITTIVGAILIYIFTILGHITFNTVKAIYRGL